MTWLAWQDFFCQWRWDENVEWRDFFARFGGSDAGTQLARTLNSDEEGKLCRESPSPYILTSWHIFVITLDSFGSATDRDRSVTQTISQNMKHAHIPPSRSLPRTNAVG
jgi:hypothetical protein